MRFTVIRFVYFLIIFLIILRLAFWQILSADDLTAMAEGQRLFKREVLGSRGKIFFSDGSVLASNEPAYLLFVQPQVIKKQPSPKDSSYLKSYSRKIALILADSDLASTLGEEERFNKIKALENDIFEKLNKNLYWVSLGKKVSVQVKKKLEELNLPGLGFDQETTRLYPEGSSSAHLLGFVASDVYGDDKGYFGLEGFYDGELKGKKGLLTLEKDALGLPILIGKFFSKEPREGKTLILSLDRTIQHLVEEKLTKGIEKYGAKGASALVMDPKTGNILAMAAFPNYDPNNPSKFEKEYFKNPLTVDGYEPGSTFKILVMAAAINEGVVEPDTVCDDCDGPIHLGGFSIRTWNNKYRPGSTMTEVIVHSDNTGMVFVARKLGIEKMYQYLSNFRIGSVTGIDLQDEQSPPLREEKDWSEIDLATASFGQGISVTATQIVRAVAAIANGGNLMEPHLVSIIKDDKKTYQVKPRVLANPITSETAKIIKEMMVKAVDEGEAKFAKPKGFKIAGKTGTAQIPVAGHYDPNKTIASFVGFAPADDPKFVMLVRFDQPSTSPYGSETAAPTFFEIAKELFLYYGIPPTE